MYKWAIALAMAGLACATPVKADGFVREKGETRIIISGVFTDSARGFDGNGNVFDLNDYDQDQVFINAEHGLTDDLTLILSPSYRNISIEGENDVSGLGYTDLGLRYALAQGSNWLVSTQALLRIPGKGRSDLLAQVGNTSTDIDGRIAAAYFENGYFVSGEGGYRFRSGDLPNEFHFDLSAGVDATDRLLLLATSANTISDGRGQGLVNQEYRYGDLYLSGVYQVTDNLRIQAGYTGTVYGKNALRQRGPLVGLWLEF